MALGVWKSELLILLQATLIQELLQEISRLVLYSRLFRGASISQLAYFSEFFSGITAMVGFEYTTAGYMTDAIIYNAHLF